MWCITRGIWLSDAHLPGKGNTATDKASRIFHNHTEWKLDSNIYPSSRQALETPTIDLFASRLNFQTKHCIVWHPDPDVFAIEAFSVDWGEHHSLAFPPFNLIDRVLQKAEADQASGRDTYCSTMDNTAMISSSDATPYSGTSHSSSKKESTPAAIQPQCHLPTPPQVDSVGLQIVKMSFQSQRLSEQAIDIVMSSWRESTKKQYRTYLARWHKFSTKSSCDPLQPTETDVIEFLTELF